jgi:hypothetical protein
MNRSYDYAKCRDLGFTDAEVSGLRLLRICRTKWSDSTDFGHPIADSESVDELAEEGNAFEANAIYGVEHARDPGVSEVITRKVPEDDVASEYLDNDEHLA